MTQQFLEGQAPAPEPPKGKRKKKIPGEVVWIVQMPYYATYPTIEKMLGVPDGKTVKPTHRVTRAGNLSGIFYQETYELGKHAFPTEAEAKSQAIQLLTASIKKQRIEIKKMEKRLKEMKSSAAEELREKP